MDKKEKMNILVLGASGAGKSTLIKAVSGARIMTGVGEGNTQKIDVYESKTWPLRFIDTKGFEYNFLKQRETIRQVKKYTSNQVKQADAGNKNDSVGIDAVWYCVEGTARRTFADNIKLMNKAIKGWKNVPVFAVITKSYSESDIPENIQAVGQSFAKVDKINLQKIIPVVAEEYKINDEVSVTPMGITELCEATLGCADSAKKINEENRKRMVIEQKRFTANVVVTGATTTAAVVGAVPVPIPDAVILVPLETGLTKAIFKIYGVTFSADLIATIVGSAAITNLAKLLIEPLKGVPIAGSVINGTVAGAIVLTLGEAEIATSEAIYTGKLDPKKIEEIVKFVEEKLKESKVVGEFIKFMQENVKDINKKNAKEIIATFLEVVAKNKLKQPNISS